MLIRSWYAATDADEWRARPTSTDRFGTQPAVGEWRDRREGG